MISHIKNCAIQKKVGDNDESDKPSTNAVNDIPESKSDTSTDTREEFEKEQGNEDWGPMDRYYDTYMAYMIDDSEEEDDGSNDTYQDSPLVR